MLYFLFLRIAHINYQVSKDADSSNEQCDGMHYAFHTKQWQVKQRLARKLRKNSAD